MINIHQLITETVPVFFFTYDVKRKIIDYVSPQLYDFVRDAGKLKGLDSHEKLKKVIDQDNQEKFQQFFDDLSKRNKYESSVELKASDWFDDIKWLEINTFHPKNHPEKSDKIVGHIVDITDKKQKYEILKSESEGIESFLNMMAHDLRAPFANIGLVVNVLKKTMAPEEIKKYQKFLDILEATSKNSGELIDRLLYLATLKGETSKMDLDLHDLRYLVTSVVKKFQHQIDDKALAISYSFPDYSVEALLDITLFQQVLNNLISNAIKFTPDGGSITFKLTYSDDKVINFSIKDSGIGIPENYISSLFTGISPLKRKGLKGEQSTGLGLYICKQILNIHKGSIAVSSKENEGTIFTIKLPVPDASSAYF